MKTLKDDIIPRSSAEYGTNYVTQTCFRNEIKLDG